jgi:hypothetical protein
MRTLRTLSAPSASRIGDLSTLSSKAPRSLSIAAVVAVCAFFAALVWTNNARADVSSWLSAGAGYGLERSAPRHVYDRATALTFGVGVGSDPTKAIVIGGMFRSTTYFTLGTDIGLSLRGASGGFARGQWGLAVDVGPAFRAWGGGDYARWPFEGMLWLGAPWGLQLGVGADLFNWITPHDPGAHGFVAILGIDFLRLTVMRQGATDRWWENPSPAGGRMPREPKE